MNQETVNRFARVLHVANCNPFLADRFYKLKTQICFTYGKFDRFDIQRITHKCWGDHERSCGPKCKKCGGTGVYSIRYHELRRWKISDYLFHEPIRSLESMEAFVRGVTVEGKIKHDKYRTSALACGVIGRLFDMAYYWDVLKYRRSECFGRFVHRIEQVARWVCDAETDYPASYALSSHCFPVFRLEPIPVELNEIPF
jgi:hypothetical protein